MGVVYSAHDELMGRDVAIKVMMTDLEGEPDIRARFMREAQVSAKLAHRNIVTIFDIGEDNGRLFIVMELLRGRDAGPKPSSSARFSIEEKVDLMLEVCEGLAVASAAGVCHRDVKPGNLFVQTDGGLKILDFGIARLASSSMTASGFIVGTPDYMSPEQARGTAIDERSDIFSVGAVLYLMLTGRKPFVAPDLPAVLHKVVSEEPPPIDPKDAPAGAVADRVQGARQGSDGASSRSFRELSAELSRWRRRYEAETRALAERVAIALDSLRDLRRPKSRRRPRRLACRPRPTSTPGWPKSPPDIPQLLASGAESLRSGEWFRRDVEELRPPDRPDRRRRGSSGSPTCAAPASDLAAGKEPAGERRRARARSPASRTCCARCRRRRSSR